MQTLAAHTAGFFNVSREIEKALRPQKEPLADSLAPHKLDCRGQAGFRFVPRVSVIAVGAGGIESASLGNRFQKRRFSAPILAGKEGHEAFKP